MIYRSQSFEQCTRQESQHRNARESYDRRLNLSFNQTNALLMSLTLNQRQLFQSLFESNRQLILVNQRTASELQQLRDAVQLQYELSPQVALQKLVTLLNACGNISTFHLNFVDCAQTFLIVLKIRFQQYEVKDLGLKMLDQSQFVLEDFRGKLNLIKS